MNPGYKNLPGAILFDLDNTLCTFIDAKRAACRAVMESIPSGSPEELFNHFIMEACSIKNPTHSFEDPVHIDDYLRKIGSYSEETAKNARKCYEETKLDNIRRYEGVKETLEELASYGIRMAVVTDADSVQARKRLKKAEIEHFFPVLVTPDISGKRKPGHDSFLLALHGLGATTTESWVVGDSLFREIYPGNALGMTTVYAEYGDWIKPDKPEIIPRHTITSFPQLLELLK